LVQGATLAPLIRILRLGSFSLTSDKTLPEAEAGARVAAAQFAEVERHSTSDGGDTHRHPRLVEQYGYRAKAAERYSEAVNELTDAKREHFTVVLAAITAGRVELIRLHRAGSIHDSVLHAIERNLDLEELSARRHLDE
jgi:monovalent cation/hydrogen antiporter